MKKIKGHIFPMTENQSFIAATVFVMLLFFIFLLTAIGGEILCWIEGHPGLASWIQATGSLLAIGIAIYIPWAQNKNQIEKQIKSEKKIAQYSGLKIIHQLGIIRKCSIGIAGALKIDAPEYKNETLIFLLQSINSIETISDESIRGISTIKSDAYLNLVQLAVHWGNGVALLKMAADILCDDKKYEKDAFLKLMNKLERDYTRIEKIAEHCISEINEFLQVECEMKIANFRS